MRKRVWLAVAIVALLHSHLLAVQKPVIKMGEPFDVTLTVDGTKERVYVRVTNLTPQIVSVVGGDEQIVVSSGGEKNTVTLHVVGVGPGDSSFATKVDHTVPELVFRRELRRVAEETRKRAAALERVRLPSGRDVYRLEDVVNVLRNIDVDLGSALFKPTWAAFRDALHDYVVSLIRRANEQASDVPASSFASNERAVLVVYHLVANARAVDQEQAQSILTEIINLLFDTAERGSTREICVQTSPPGFEITLSPRSYPPDAQTVTAPSLLTIRTGAQKFRIGAHGVNLESNGELDFLRNPRLVIECPVKFKSSDPEACRFLEGAATPCPP